MSDADTALKRGPKCAQVLEGARKVFMDRGYEGASVDEIARVAGTSKATLYSYFPDKRQLFEAVMQTQCGRTGTVIDHETPDESVETTLRRMAVSFSTFLFSPGAQEMFRVCIAEAGRFPELGAAFHASGPARRTRSSSASSRRRAPRRPRHRRSGDGGRTVRRPLQGRALPARAPRRPARGAGRDRPRRQRGGHDLPRALRKSRPAA